MRRRRPAAVTGGLDISNVTAAMMEAWRVLGLLLLLLLMLFNGRRWMLR